MKITNLNIYGGSQQFAEIIINSSKLLTEEDTELIRLIGDNAKSNEEKQDLVKSVEVLKDEKVSSVEKIKAKSLLKKFFESIASERGKQIVFELLKNGPTFLSNL